MRYVPHAVKIKRRIKGYSVTPHTTSLTWGCTGRNHMLHRVSFGL